MRRLTPRNRLLVLVVTLLLLSAYFVPLWTIRMVAPQYPEGMGMHLWVNRITGHAPHDLQNINLLNHYIGMDPIVEQAIPEFQYMPYILGFMILGAIVALLYPRRLLIYLGLLNLLLVGAAGGYDFWRWEYNYGHNLHPDAPISIPGMAYQPPLIGCKDLLNITACSWPHIGGIALLAVGAILAWILFSEMRRGRYVENDYFTPCHPEERSDEGSL